MYNAPSAFDEQLGELVAKIESDGLAYTAENYAHSFELDFTAAQYAYELAVTMHLLEERMRELCNDAGISFGL